MDIISNVQAYLKEPGPVELRKTNDGSALVSGLVRSTDRTDQTLFDQLNHEESSFRYSKIIAFVNDIGFAKKRLLSRSARYTGLLDKLDFAQAESPGALPSASQLDGVKTWVAYLDHEPNMLERVQEIASLAKASSSLANLAIVLAGANELDTAACQQALDSLKGSEGLQYTLVAVGKLTDKPQGTDPYQLQEFGTPEGFINATCEFSRDESCRLISELLQLESGANKAFSFMEVDDVNATEYKLVKGLRAAGYTRTQELDHMVRDGPKVGVQRKTADCSWDPGVPPDFNQYGNKTLSKLLFVFIRTTLPPVKLSWNATPTMPRVTPPISGGSHPSFWRPWNNPRIVTSGSRRSLK